MLEPELIITGLVAVATCVAALFTYRNHLVSKRALGISEQQHDFLKANISAYLADSFRSYNSDLKQEKYIFSIAYTNKSHVPDCIVEVVLEVFYTNSQNRVSSLSSRHEINSGHWLSGGAQPALVPMVLPPRASVTGWFVFEMNPIAGGYGSVKKYRVVARNSIGEEVGVQSYILREIKYEELS